MSSRNAFFYHLLLFMVAYGGFLGWLFHPNTDSKSSVLANNPKARYVLARSSQPQALAIAGPAGAQSHEVDKTVDAVLQTDEVPAGGHARATPAELADLSLQAVSAARPVERAKAIVAFRFVGVTPETLRALAQVISADRNVRNRRLAVTTLRSFMTEGGDNDEVGSLLRQAMMDNDPGVVRLAQEPIGTGDGEVEMQQ